MYRIILVKDATFAMFSYYKINSIIKPPYNPVSKKTAKIFINFKIIASKGKRIIISYNRYEKLFSIR